MRGAGRELELFPDALGNMGDRFILRDDADPVWMFLSQFKGATHFPDDEGKAKGEGFLKGHAQSFMRAVGYQ